MNPAPPAAIIADMNTRDYEAIFRRLRIAPDADRTARMRNVSDLLWETLHPTGVSWVGFYVQESGDELILGPRRDKPACSPIGLHGACGRSFLTKAPLVVRDVRDLGANYVACDPRDQSECVVPCIAPDGSCWGVLDLDSFDIGAFTDDDAIGLARLLRAAGLSS